MRIARLSSAYAVIDTIQITSITVDPIRRVVSASAQYAFTKNGQIYPATGINYTTNVGIPAISTMVLREPTHITSIITLTDNDYTIFETYFKQTQDYAAALLATLKQLNIIGDYTLQ